LGGWGETTSAKVHTEYSSQGGGGNGLAVGTIKNHEGARLDEEKIKKNTSAEGLGTR